MTAWQIEDDEKTLLIGTEEQMNRAMLILTWNLKSLHQIYSDKKLEEYRSQYRVDKTTIKGKLRMVEKKFSTDYK